MRENSEEMRVMVWRGPVDFVGETQLVEEKASKLSESY